MKGKDFKPSAKSVTIGGQTYDLKFDMNALCELEEIYGDANDAISGMIAGKAKAIRAVLYAALKSSLPAGTTLEAFGAMIGIGELTGLARSLRGAVSDAMPEPEPEAGAGET